MSKYDAVNVVGDNQVINRVSSFKTRNQGAFRGSLAALVMANVHLHQQNYTGVYSVGTA